MGEHPVAPDEPTNVVRFPEKDPCSVSWLVELLGRDADSIKSIVGAVVFKDGTIKLASTQVELGDLVLCSKIMETFVNDEVKDRYETYEDD